ncbi:MULTISPECIES: hypothetical protein [unclassified Arthrobacter]|nr:hypothetical protein [Arthrobacter sp. MAHUQ-56]MBX7444219.1 hypothetical protein [Arthrobacter sp. MAHUQ-56]
MTPRFQAAVLHAVRGAMAHPAVPGPPTSAPASAVREGRALARPFTHGAH